jgi:hypothetical protein
MRDRYGDTPKPYHPAARSCGERDPLEMSKLQGQAACPKEKTRPELTGRVLLHGT